MAQITPHLLRQADSLLVRLQCRAADTPDTPEKITGYQRKAPIHAGCTPDTPDTPCFVDTPAIVQIEPFGQAVNDLDSHAGAPGNLQKPAIPVAANDPATEPPTDPNAWRELAGPSMHDFMADTAKELGLIPEADGYTEDGDNIRHW